MLRTVADQPTLWEAILPEELRRLPAELARVDVLLDAPVTGADTPLSRFGDECVNLRRGAAGSRCRVLDVFMG